MQKNENAINLSKVYHDFESMQQGDSLQQRYKQPFKKIL